MFKKILLVSSVLSYLLACAPVLAQDTGITTGEQLLEPDPQEHILTYLTPYDDGQAKDILTRLIQSAKHSIYVCAYGLTDQSFTSELVQAFERGIDVKVVMDKTQSVGSYQLACVNMLKKSNLPIFIGRSDKGQLVHAKFIVVDEAIVESGSYNFTRNADAQNNTIDIIFSPKRAELFIDYWNRIKEGIVRQQSGLRKTKKEKIYAPENKLL